MSLPARERGLKPGVKQKDIAKKASLPARERGLKLTSRYYYIFFLCRSPRGSVD